MAIFTVQVTKSTPESKLGISFSAEGGRVVLTKISENGLFASTALAVGQEILSINETRVAGMDIQEVLSILKSIPEVVTIEAKATNLFHLTYEEKKIKSTDGEGGVFIKTKFEVNSDRSVVPQQLAELGVTTTKWMKIVDAYSYKLLPSMYESNQMDKSFVQEMTSFVGAQMVGGAVGFGTESRREKKAFSMTYQASILADNCNLHAYNVLAKANALLNAHGILAQLTFSSTPVPKWSEKLQQEKNVVLRPSGIEFVSLDD